MFRIAFAIVLSLVVVSVSEARSFFRFGFFVQPQVVVQPQIVAPMQIQVVQQPFVFGGRVVSRGSRVVVANGRVVRVIR